MRDRELLAVDRDHAVDHLAFALADTLHVHRRALDSHAVRRGPTDQVRDLGASDHVLAWQAGDVWTRASNQGALDHDDGPALLRQVPCEILARLTAAEDGVLDVYGLIHGGPHRLAEKSPLRCDSRLIGSALSRTRAERRRFGRTITRTSIPAILSPALAVESES